MAGSDPYSSTSHLVYLPGWVGRLRLGRGGCAGAPVIIARAPPVISDITDMV